MEKLREYAAVCTIGSVGYSAIEVLWRGFTHWTMALTGGVVFSVMAPVRKSLQGVSWVQRCVAGSALITTAEFIVGCVVNLHYGLGIWDYSRERFNLLGQVCAKYAALWFLLAAPAMGLSTRISGLLENK